jgi:hypothetical protein
MLTPEIGTLLVLPLDKHKVANEDSGVDESMHDASRFWLPSLQPEGMGR